MSVFQNIGTTGSITTGSFAAKVDFTTGSAPDNVAIGDLDGDGKPDLAVVNQNSNSISLFRNTSGGGSISFATKVDLTTGPTPTSIVLGDIDGDGKADLVTTNYSSNTVSVFRNIATSGTLVSGSFVAHVDFATGNNPYHVAVGDLDGDGIPDLAVADLGSGLVSVLRNSPLIAPTTQATNVLFTSTTATTTTASWTNGNGASRAVFIKAASSGSPAPVDLTAYAANAAFASGTQIASTGWYCVYNGTGTTVNITGLTTGTTYRVMTVEYNGTGSNVAYQTAAGIGNPANVTTLGPVISATGTLTAVNTTYGTASATPTTFNISATNLTANLVITPPTGFEVSSTSASSGYAATASLVPSSGTVATTAIYLRLAATTAVGTYGASGNVVCTSTGATTVNVATVSSTVTAAALMVTATGPSKTYGTALTAGTSTTNFTVTGTPASGQALTSVTLTPDAAGLSATTATGASYMVTPSAATGTGGFLASNYNITYTPFNGTVTAAALTVTATGPSKTYGTALTAGTSTTNFTVTGTPASGQALTSVTLTPDAAGLSATTAAGAGYSVTPSSATGTGGFLASNYNITYTPFNGTVTTAALTVTAAGPSKTYGTALTAGASTNNFTITGTPASGETLTSVTLTPDAAGLSATTVAGAAYVITPGAATGTGGFLASNYNITYTPFNGTVSTAALTVTATGPSKTYGTALTAGTSTTNFTVTGTPASGEALTSVTLTPDAAGLSATTAAGAGYVITPSAATGTGGFLASNYNITYTPFNGTVTTAALTVTATGPSKTYGTALTAGTSTNNFTITGTPAAGETLTSVTLTPDAAGLSATTAASAGYAVTPSAATGTGGFLASNYNITYAPFNGTVTAAALTITATTANKTYGQTLTSAAGNASGFSLSGIKNSETVGSVTLTYGTGAAATANVGTYTNQVTPSLATGGTFTASNYAITYAPGNIVVGAATLTITANDVNKIPGNTLTNYAGSSAFASTGLQNSESAGTVSITYGTGAAAGDAPGTYANQVTPSARTGGSITASNYSISYVSGAIVVGTSTITTSGSLSVLSTTYGTASGTSTFTVSGSNLSNDIVVTPPTGFEIASSSSGPFAGTVTLTQSGGGVGTTHVYVRLAATTPVGNNYNGNVVVSSTGAASKNMATVTSTVSAAAITITASNATKNYGTAITGGGGFNSLYHYQRYIKKWEYHKQCNCCIRHGCPGYRCGSNVFKFGYAIGSGRR